MKPLDIRAVFWYTCIVNVIASPAIAGRGDLNKPDGLLPPPLRGRNDEHMINNFWTKLQKPILCLAPMAGVTDRAFRPLCKRFGADVIFTEFASTDALIHGNIKTREMISYDPIEQPVVCQLFGNDPKKFEESAKILQEMGFAGVDINFGCPAYKVVTHGGGVILMREPDLCRAIVEATCNAVSIPVSVKIRSSIACTPSPNRRGLGVRSTNEVYRKTALDLVDHIKDLPVASIMIHGRSYEKPFDGEPDVEMIARVRKAFSGLLIANGGIHTPEDAKKMLDATGADGVGIARGSWGAPWIFKQIKDYLETGSYQEFTWKEKIAVIIDHTRLALEHKDDHGIIELRKHLAWYVKGFSGASQLRQRLVRVKTLDEITKILRDAQI